MHRCFVVLPLQNVVFHFSLVLIALSVLLLCLLAVVVVLWNQHSGQIETIQTNCWSWCFFSATFYCQFLIFLFVFPLFFFVLFCVHLWALGDNKSHLPDNWIEIYLVQKVKKNKKENTMEKISDNNNKTTCFVYEFIYGGV